MADKNTGLMPQVAAALPSTPEILKQYPHDDNFFVRQRKSRENAIAAISDDVFIAAMHTSNVKPYGQERRCLRSLILLAIGPLEISSS